MARLPQPGRDEGDWGSILNNFLLYEHNSDGTHDLSAILLPPATAGKMLVSDPGDDAGMSWQSAGLSALPSGGSAGQYLSKTSNDDYDAAWIDLPSSPVTMVNGRTGSIILHTDDIGEGATNLYFTDQRAINAVAGLGYIRSTNNLSDVASTATARSNLGLGSNSLTQFAGFSVGGSVAAGDIRVYDPGGGGSYTRMYRDQYNSHFLASGGACVFHGGLIIQGANLPNSDNAYTDGRSDLYWKETYSHKLFFNSGANIDGTMTGVMAVSDAANFSFGTTTGTKIGTTSAQKLGFYGSIPISRPTGVAITVNAIHSALVNLGLIAA